MFVLVAIIIPTKLTDVFETIMSKFVATLPRLILGTDGDVLVVKVSI